MILVPGLPTPLRWVGWGLALASWPFRVYFRAYLRTELNWPLLIFTFGLLLGVYASVDRRLSVEALLSFCAVGLLYYAIVNNPTTRHLWALTFLGGVIAFGVIPWVFSQGQIPPSKLLSYNQWAIDLASRIFPRIGPFSPHMNALAGGLNAIIPVLLGITLFGGSWWFRLVSVAGASLLVMTVAMSGSRAGMIGLAVGFFVVAMLRSRWFLICIPVGVISLYALTLLGFVESGDMLGMTSGQTFIGRTEVWRTTLEMLMDVPFTGVGLASYPLVFPIYMPPSLPPVLITNPHNAVLMLFADAGLLGLAGALWAGWKLLAIAWRTAWLRRRGALAGVAAGLTASIAGQVAFGMFESTISTIFVDASGAYHYIASPILALVLGMFIVAHQLTQDSQPEHPATDRPDSASTANKK
jgi:O-antigen ligase